MKRDPFGLLTPSMVRFNSGESDWYESKDGFHHQLDGSKTQMTTRCIGCGRNRTDPFSTIQTQDNELIAAEVAHWQMHHRTVCKLPSAAVVIH